MRNRPKPSKAKRPARPASGGKERYCVIGDTQKRKYSSAGAARRGGHERYGQMSNTYRCSHCSMWHVTRRGVPNADPHMERETDPELNRIIEAAFGIGAGE